MLIQRVSLISASIVAHVFEDCRWLAFSRDAVVANLQDTLIRRHMHIQPHMASAQETRPDHQHPSLARLHV
jgi:hypothetical protein